MMTMKSRPSVSVAVPTHRKAHLRSCLNSILRQTLPPTELIVSQDGDDPAITQLVDDLPKGGLSVRHILNESPLGQLANRTQAFQCTAGEFVAMLDDDDEWESTFLEKTVGALIAHPQCGFCTTDHYIIDEGGLVLRRETFESSKRFGRSSMTSRVYDDVLWRQLNTKPFSLHTTLFRRSVLSELGFFPSDGGTVPDFALFLELGARRTSALYLAERLGKYRVHSGQQTRSRREPSRDQARFLEGFRSRHKLADREERLVRRRFHDSVIELAIAHAHQRERRAVLAALRGYSAMGWEWPRMRRIVALVALLAGVRKPRRTPRDVLSA
jgi:glycosyltransferase involved in cell wall biosynthesis